MRFSPMFSLVGICPAMQVLWPAVRAFETERRLEGRADHVWASSGTDGTSHSETSLHWSGQAVDLDGDPGGFDNADLAQFLSRELPEEFDVVYETTHVHVEWQPKRSQRVKAHA